MYRTIEGVRVWGEPIDERAVAQAARCLREAPEAVAAALMADHHVGYSMPIGGVIAYVDAVSPSGVGYDIGCGNTCVLTDLRLEHVQRDLPSIMDEIAATVSFGIGSKARNSDHTIFNDQRWNAFADVGRTVQEQLLKTAREQLGSVGAGNHYVDLFRDDDDRIWVGTHFGSRGFGHRTATGFLNLARGAQFLDKPARESMDAASTVLPLTSAIGQLYWAAMELAADYARAGRTIVLRQVLRILGATSVDWIENNHNQAWRERQTIDGDITEVVVVRKGATPAFPGQRGFVGGSMGDSAAIVVGIDTPAAQAALHSTIHGAGRVMSRTQAGGKLNWKTGMRSGGQITREMMLQWLDERGVILRGAGTDEAPQAYKRLDAVLEAQRDSIDIERRLHPIGVVMAGESEFDPYRD
ncbi:MAG: RNA-splicing ligase RtcB [Chloroflexi bacterium]|nr:MAG: RNA-splicing ligase RtcB [Chloroflexota bacterium]